MHLERQSLVIRAILHVLDFADAGIRGRELCGQCTLGLRQRSLFVDVRYAGKGDSSHRWQLICARIVPADSLGCDDFGHVRNYFLASKLLLRQTSSLAGAIAGGFFRSQTVF
jgi:hypothetical protein